MRGRIITLATLLALAGALAGSAAPCPAPDASQPTGVTGGDDGPATITWTEVREAMYYQFWVLKDGKVFHKKWYMGETEWTSDGALPAGDYAVYIQTWSPCGSGAWSTGLTFAVACPVGQAPWPSEPSGDVFDLEFDGSFVFNRGSPQATWYNLAIERNGKSYRNLWRSYDAGYDAGDTRHEISARDLDGVLPCGTYSWKIRSWGSCIGLTDWSSDFDFTVNCCTAAPTTVEGVTLYEFWGYGSSVLDPRPALAWEDYGDAAWYNLYLERNGKKYLDEWTSVPEWERHADMPPGDYVVSVRGWNPCGMGTWSAGSAFTIECTEPTAPAGLHPLFGYGYGFGMMDAAVGWQDQPGVYHYQVKARRDGREVYNRWLDYTKPDDPLYGGSTITAFPEKIGRHGDYTLWVRAWNHCGTTAWSDGLDFTVDCELTQPTFRGPAGTVSDPRPFFTWDRQDFVGTYRMIVQRDGASYADLTLDNWQTVAYSGAEEANSFAAIGSGQGWQGDDTNWVYQLPFGFPFFGETQTWVYVNSNGALHFGSGSSDYRANTQDFRDMAMIGVLWSDLRTDGSNHPAEDVYVAIGPGQVTFRWQGETFADGSPVNCSATLYPDGTVRLRYGSGNIGGGLVGISAGDGARFNGEEITRGMDYAEDLVFSPTGRDSQVGVVLDWDLPNGDYRCWLQPSSDCYGGGPWSDAQEFTVEQP